MERKDKMTKCKSYSIFKAPSRSGNVWKIRLNIIEFEGGMKKYRQKIISTDIPAKKPNECKAYVIAEEEKNRINKKSTSCSMDRFFDEWLNWKKENRIEISTYEEYEYLVNYMRPFFRERHLTVEEITPEIVRSLYNYIAGIKKRYSDETISARTARNIQKVFVQVMKHAVVMKAIPYNPCEGLPFIRRLETHEEKAYIGVDELGDFFNAIKGHRLENAFKIAIYCGLRREELCALRWDAIRDGSLYIERTVVRIKTKQEKPRTKSRASCRSFPITPEIHEILEETRKTQESYRKLFGDDYQDSGKVFTWEDGRAFSPDYISRSFKKIVLESEGLDHSLTLHSLRASCASMLIHNGTDIKDVQKWLGHSDVSTTLNIYTRTNKAQQLKVANNMSAIFTRAAVS